MSMFRTFEIQDLFNQIYKLFNTGIKKMIFRLGELFCGPGGIAKNLESCLCRSMLKIS